MRRSDHSMRPPTPAATPRARLAERLQPLPRQARRGLGREDDPRLGRGPVVRQDPARGAPRGRCAQGGLEAAARDARLPARSRARRDRDGVARAAARRLSRRREVAGAAGPREGRLAARARGRGDGARGGHRGARPRPRRRGRSRAARPREGGGRARRRRPRDASPSPRERRSSPRATSTSGRSSPGPTTSPPSTTSATCTSSAATPRRRRSATARRSRCDPTTWRASSTSRWQRRAWAGWPRPRPRSAR